MLDSVNFNHSLMRVVNMTQTDTCRLLNLPQEIRDSIYRYALVAPDDEMLVWPAKHFDHDLAPSLLATCREIHKQAGDILYSKNTFAFNHPSDCNIFQRIMDQQHCRKLCQVEFRLKERDLKLWVNYFGPLVGPRALPVDLPNLTSLHLCLRQSNWGFGVDLDEALRNWHNSKPLKYLKVHLDGRTPDTAEVLITVHMRIAEAQLVVMCRNNLDLFEVATTSYARTKIYNMDEKLSAVLEMTLMSAAT